MAIDKRAFRWFIHDHWSQVMPVRLKSLIPIMILSAPNAFSVVLACEEYDKATLANLLRGSQASTYDVVELIYEGEFRFPIEIVDESIDPGGVHVRFSGTFRASPPRDAYFLDLILDYPNKRRISKRTVAIKDGIWRSFARDEDGAKPTLKERPVRYFTDLHFNESFCSIYPLPILLEELERPETVVKHAGMESIDGHSCEVFEFHFASQARDNSTQTLRRRIWVDFERGGNILQLERYWPNGQLVRRLENVQLKRFEARFGETVWLPIKGYDERYEGLGELYELGQLLNMIDVYVLTNSVSFKQFDENDFLIDIAPDAFRAGLASGRQGGRPMSDADAEALLVEHLAELESQGSELKASSYSRGGGGWAWIYWASPAVSVLASAVAVVIYLRARV